MCRASAYLKARPSPPALGSRGCSDAIANTAEALNISIDYLVIDNMPRRPLHTQDHGLAHRLVALAELDQADRDSMLSVLDAMLTRKRLKALAGGDTSEETTSSRSGTKQSRDPVSRLHIVNIEGHPLLRDRELIARHPGRHSVDHLQIPKSLENLVDRPRPDKRPNATLPVVIDNKELLLASARAENAIAPAGNGPSRYSLQ